MKPWITMRIGFLLLLTASLAIGGCEYKIVTASDAPATTTFGPGDEMVQTELYFGLGLKGGGSITPEQWSDFTARVITPRFPDGLTIIPAQGQWRNSSGTLAKENTMEVIIIHPPKADLDKAIEEIRNLYKKQFNQESVLRSSHAVRASF